MKHYIYIVLSTLFTLTLLSLGSEPLSAQHEKTTEVWATGSYTVGKDENISIKEAYAKALFNAKEDALRQAGVNEDIYSVAVIEIGGDGDNFREINSEWARIEIEGRVKVKKQTDTMQFQNGLYTYITTIRAEVKVEEADEDPLFDFTTKGLHNTYWEGEKMTFTVTPTKDCYLRIFYFDKSANHQLFPIENVYKDILFKADTSYTFPLPHDLKYLYDRFSTAREYPMSLSDKNSVSEQGELFIIALKAPVRYNDEVTYENVNRWLSRIKRKDKRVHWFGINIAKR